LKRTLDEIGLDAGYARTQPEVNSISRRLTAGILRTWQHFLTVEEILEICPIPFEANRINVGQVIGDHVQLRFQRLHACRGGVEGLYAHDSLQ